MINFWMNNDHFAIFGFVRSYSYYVHAIEIPGEPNQYFSIGKCITMMEDDDNIKIDVNLLEKGFSFQKK